MKTQTASPKRHSKKRPPRRRGGKGRRSVSFFRRVPSWVIWLGGILIAAAYIFFFYRFFVDPFSFRWRAIFGEPTYPEGYEVRGIDISHYQERVNWDKLRYASIGGAPVSFVFIKATEGEKLLDDNFRENFAKSHRNDIICGAYHFFVPGVDPRKQAQFYLKTAQLRPGDLPPVLDIEGQVKVAPEELRRDIKVWLDTVEQAYGVRPIIYTNHDFKLKYLNTPEFDAYPYWIARYYINELKYKGKWAFWQHTDRGKVSGIKGFVDCNIFNGSLKDLLNLTLPEAEKPSPDLQSEN